MKAMSKQQDGVALCYRKSEHFEVKETVEHGPNDMAFQLKMGSRQIMLLAPTFSRRTSLPSIAFDLHGRIAQIDAHHGSGTISTSI